MDHRHLASILVFDESKKQETARRPTNVSRAMSILKNEYDNFLSKREYVIKHMHKLKGQYIPTEVSRITNCPSRECVIINDHYVCSYTEVEGWLYSLEQHNNQLAKLKGMEGEDGRADAASECGAETRDNTSA